MSCAAFSRAEDPFMGDWQGCLSLDGREQSVAVYMVPRGNRTYEARFVNSFSARGPWLYRLRGTIDSGQFRFMDDIPLEPNRIIRSTDDGLVVRASLWAGSVEGTLVRGEITGRGRGRFELRQTERPSPSLGLEPPAGALILYDGTGLEAWRSRNADKPISWKQLPDGVLEIAGSGNIVSRETFGDLRLHLEFRLPYMPKASGQGRGNSGVYLQGRYEVQVLDSYGLEGVDNECGGIYKVARPNLNMCAPPLQWQTYDITFQAPRFDPGGRKQSNARITVLHNGVAIHKDLQLPEPTGGALGDKEVSRGPLMLQDHGNPVQFRNIWIECFEGPHRG